MTAEGRKIDRASARASVRENCASGIQSYPFLFRVPPKATRTVLEKAASPPRRLHSETSWTHPNKQLRVCWTSRPQTRRPVFLHFRPLNSLQPRTSPGRLCGQLLFPLYSSAVGLFISLHGLSSLPDTCVLQAALECWVSQNNRRLWTGLRPGPSQYLLECEATVLKLLPSRTQQWGVPRGFKIFIFTRGKRGVEMSK